MPRHYCTSIANAIKYFEAGSTKKTSKTISGEEYTSTIPPDGFVYINMTDEQGITIIFNGWFDYVEMLKSGRMNNNHRIVKIKLCYIK